MDSEDDDKFDDTRDMSGLKSAEVKKEVRVNEVTQMGINSAEKHNIKLKQGRENSADGNCAYQSVIFNINDRECFKTQLPMDHRFDEQDS